MPMDGQHQLPSGGATADTPPQDLLPVGDSLRRPPGPGADADPLTPWRRAALHRMVGWLARRFEAVADGAEGDAVERYAGYADLLRRIDGDMSLRRTATGRRRGHLTVVSDD